MTTLVVSHNVQNSATYWELMGRIGKEFQNILLKLDTNFVIGMYATDGIMMYADKLEIRVRIYFF